jgi:hypothetical protein
MINGLGFAGHHAQAGLSNLECRSAAAHAAGGGTHLIQKSSQ